MVSWFHLNKDDSPRSHVSAANKLNLLLQITWSRHWTAIGWPLSTSGNLLNGIELSSLFFQLRWTTFNTWNDQFQHSTWHDTLFNICWTRAATFVDQQMLKPCVTGLRFWIPRSMREERQLAKNRRTISKLEFCSCKTRSDNSVKSNCYLT